MSEPTARTITYLVSRFPKATETFIVNEAVSVAARGYNVHIRSLSRTDETTLHDAAKTLAPTVVFGERRPLTLARSVARWTIRSPKQMARVWGAVVTAHWRRPGLLARTAYATVVGIDWADELAAADHVHAHWATYPAHIAWVAHRLTGLRYSITAHAHDIQLPNPLMATKMREADLVVTISDHNRRWLLHKVGADLADKLHVVRCGVDTDQFAPSGVRGGASGDVPGDMSGRPFTFVSVASFLAYKGHAVLLEAFAQLVRGQTTPSRAFRLQLIGDGELRPEIERTIEQLGLKDFVELLGWRGAHEVRALVGSADAFVLASIITPDGQTEGIPVALMEAMASGTPVIATRVSGIPELIIDGQTGWLVAHSDPSALRQAMADVAADPTDTAVRSQAARTHVVEEFDADRNADLLARLFATVIR